MKQHDPVIGPVGAVRVGLALALGLVGSGASAADGNNLTVFPTARSVVPFVEHGDIGCSWMMHAAGEKWVRGSIGQGDEEPVLSLVDWVFFNWSDSEDHEIEISVGDPDRRVPARAWAGNAGGQTPGGIGFYLDAPLRQLIGNAASLQVWKEGKPVLHLLLAGTPSSDELDGCVRPPSPDGGDSE